MLCELIYTSAPETMDGPGYGVVAKSADFPQPLEKFIRHNLNQYDFSANESDDAESSVVYSHTQFKDENRDWHVLSSVRFAGRDYTQRAVFLAHHCAVTADECEDRAVASVMLSPNLFVRKWHGSVGVLPPRPLPSMIDMDGPLRTWRELTGDSLSATTWLTKLSTSSNTSFLVVPDSLTGLKLFIEALSLLPIAQSNAVTFLTSLTSERKGLHFHWVGIHPSSRIARTVRGQFADRTVDVTNCDREQSDASPAVTNTSSLPAAPRATVSTEANDQLAKPKRRRYQLATDSLHEISHSTELQTATSPVPPPPPPPPPPIQVASRSLYAIISVVAALSVLLPIGVYIFWKVANATALPTAVKSEPNTAIVDIPNPKPSTEISSQNAPTFEPRTKESQDGKVTLPDVAQEPAKPKMTPDVQPGTKGTFDQRETEALQPLNAFIDTGLRASLSDASSGKYARLLKLDAPLGAQMRLIVPDFLKTKLQWKREQQPGTNLTNAIRVESPDRTFAIIRLQDSLLEWQCSDNADELLTCLQFCVLQVTPRLARNVRVAFTPVLSAIPPSLKEWSEPLSADAIALLYAIHKSGETTNPRIRIEGVSLSILPPGNSGWQCKPALATVARSFESQADITHTPNERFAGTFLINTFFNREEEKGRAPIEWTVRIKPRTSDSNQTPTSPESDASRDSLSQPSDGRQERSESPKSVPEKTRRAKKQGTPLTIDEPPGSPDPAPPVIDNATLIQQLLSHFGRMTCAVTVSVQCDGMTEELELIRFGTFSNSTEAMQQ